MAHLMELEEQRDKDGPEGYEGYIKFQKRILRAREAAKYDEMSDQVKFNMYVNNNEIPQTQGFDAEEGW